MGDYLTQGELEDRFENNAEIETLCDVAVGSGMADADVVIRMADVIEAAEGEINSGLAMRYATPVDVSTDTTLAALLKRKTLDVAEVYLHRRGEGASEIKQDQLDKALEWVDMVATGKRKLVGALTAASTTSANPRAGWSDASRTLADTSTGRVFTRKSGSRL